MVAYSSYGFSYHNQGYSFDNDTASIGGGAFYNFPIHSRLTAGMDGRVLYGPASRGGTTADVALRNRFKFRQRCLFVPISRLAVEW